MFRLFLFGQVHSRLAARLGHIVTIVSREEVFLNFFIKTQMTDFSGCCILIMATTSQVKTTTTKIEVLQIGEVMVNNKKKTMTTLFTRCY